MSIITLNDLPLNSSCKIISLNCSDSLKRRLLDLGLTVNTPVYSRLKSPFGDPTAYEFRGSTIALREEDAKLIICEF